MGLKKILRDLFTIYVGIKLLLNPFYSLTNFESIFFGVFLIGFVLWFSLGKINVLR